MMKNLFKGKKNLNLVLLLKYRLSKHCKHKKMLLIKPLVLKNHIGYKPMKTLIKLSNKYRKYKI